MVGAHVLLDAYLVTFEAEVGDGTNAPIDRPFRPATERTRQPFQGNDTAPRPAPNSGAPRQRRTYTPPRLRRSAAAAKSLSAGTSKAAPLVSCL
jgi:hypothetical protein